MVPSESSHQHGPPLLRWLRLPGVSHLPHSYAALRLPCLHPSRFGCPSQRLDSGPRARSLRSLGRLGRFDVRAANVERVGEWSPGPRSAGFFPRETRVSQVPGSSSSHAPWSSTPPGPPPLPIASSAVVSSEEGKSWTPGILTFSRLHSHGSHARAPTHRRPCYQRRRKARFRSVRVHLLRAGFAPAGRLFRISRSHRILPSFLTSLAWSHP